MQPLIDHARAFGQRPQDLAGLAAGQAPEILCVTGSDSRVVPARITGARPGRLFELRTAGDFVPPCGAGSPSGEAATIEYAVEVLGVSEIVVCGHSHCGAVGALVRGDDLTAVPAVRDVAAAVQHHVLAQLLRLRTCPCAERRLADGSLRTRGWYEIHTGTMRAHRPGTDAFEQLQSARNAAAVRGGKSG